MRAPGARPLSRRAALACVAAALAPRARSTPDQTFRFCGREWRKRTSAQPVGPGPCHFGAESVRLAEDGVHLSIQPVGGKWVCAEMVCLDRLGYGRYEFDVADTSCLDQNAVLGLFTYDTTSPESQYREIDIEISRWAEPSHHNIEFVVQPAGPRNALRFALPPGPATHSFEWTPGQVDCMTRQGRHRVRHHRFRDGVPRAGNGQPRINLWLFRGRAPNTGTAAEVVIRRFEFTPR